MRSIIHNSKYVNESERHCISLLMTVAMYNFLSLFILPLNIGKHKTHIFKKEEDGFF